MFNCYSKGTAINNNNVVNIMVLMEMVQFGYGNEAAIAVF